MEDDMILKNILGESSDVVNWIKTGLEVAKNHNNSLETMLDIFKCGWGMSIVFETFARGSEGK